MMAKFDFADGETECNGAIFDIDADTGITFGVKNIRYSGEIK